MLKTAKAPVKQALKTKVAPFMRHAITGPQTIKLNKLINFSKDPGFIEMLKNFQPIPKPDCRISLYNLRTLNQDGTHQFFHPFADALTLAMDVYATDDLLKIPGVHFSAQFQILNPMTNEIVINQEYESPFQWGGNFWISLGNNWAPNESGWDTPEKWNIPYWTSQVFGFRALITASEDPNQVSENGPVRAFAVAEETKWFVVQPWFRL